MRIALIAIMLLTITGCIPIPEVQKPPEKSHEPEVWAEDQKEQPKEKKEEKKEEEPVVTLDMYHKIKNGMTYKEVVKIVGAEGIEEVSSSGVVNMTSYSWNNPDRSKMTVMFENGKVSSKVQILLK